MMMMMKSPQSSIPISRNSKCGISRVFRVLFCSTGTVTSPSSKDTLRRRLVQFGKPTPGFSVQGVLDQWVGEGRALEREELRVTIRHLRKFKRFKEAPEVHGPEHAEKYFCYIPITLIGVHVYGALLHCFAHAKNIEKTEAVMQKVRELGFAKTALTYNVMLKLYSDMGNHDKLDSLMQEMQEKGIACDKFTYNTRLNSYAYASDLDGMEKLLMKMEADPVVTMSWHAYVVVANGYLKAGAVEKASSMLKKSEQLVRGKERRFAYEVILSLYASIGNKEEVKGLLGNAESIVNRLLESGVEPIAGIWQHLAAGYHENGEGEKALEPMKKAIAASHPGWKAKIATVAACLEYLKGKGSIEAAEEFIEVPKEKGCIPTELCDKFVKKMRSAKLESEARDPMGGHKQALEGEQSGKELKGEIIS
ncbi:hypothetical protein RHMOL_Rhmol04G0107200 [Rhododendron molle]|uniref:Uncharacterized protein n=1 Tax=Rhododendron molle TaxID=49168 RepID=A0ACC0NZ29_RHOML|nr:hypothetical protein RHMOL_Rhmol04G0107200 [Rhododendron molle]